jgi:hypothetical protein
VWRQLAVQTYDTLHKYSDIIERDYRLSWQCRREARFSLLFEEGIKEIVSPVELGTWRETLLERQTKQRAIQDEIEVIAKEWSPEAGVALQETGASLIRLGMRIDEQRDLVNSISVTHASGLIPSQWIVDKRKLKNSTASVEASALNEQAERIIQLARAELLKVRQKLASTMKIILGA